MIGLLHIEVLLLLFTQPNSINSRAIMGYFKENYASAVKLDKKTRKKEKVILYLKIHLYMDKM